LLVILSNIPSHPNMTKSVSSVISTTLVDASAITTLGLPPNSITLASKSPIVLDTDNLPGNTHNGP